MSFVVFWVFELCTFWVFEFCHISSYWIFSHFGFSSCQTLSFWVMSHSELCHIWSFCVLSHFEIKSFVKFWVFDFCHIFFFERKKIYLKRKKKLRIFFGENFFSLKKKFDKKVACWKKLFFVSTVTTVTPFTTVTAVTTNTTVTTVA